MNQGPVGESPEGSRSRGNSSNDSNSTSRNSIVLTLLFACTIFLSAFLLFQVQPLVGKMILPWFGGSASVWTTCLLFFQAVLLLGYLYAHWLVRVMSPSRQAVIHVLALAASLAVLPVVPAAGWKPAGGEDPSLLIIGLLGVTIGLPYLLLSTTGPLLQAWFSRQENGAVPYRLFALSNLGSMLGLLSYPVLFEPFLSIPDMSRGWSFAYAAFVVLCATIAIRARHAGKSVIAADAVGSTPAGDAGNVADVGKIGEAGKTAPRGLLTWIALAACPTIFLMAVTSHLTQNVAPIPFLWVLPLALYLLSFIVCFEGGHWYRRRWYLPLYVVWLAAASYDLVYRLWKTGTWVPIIFYSAGLFIACMLGHGELARKKPHPRHLTSFYLMIAIGGVLGGIFTALVAPRIFNDNYELPLIAVLVALIGTTLAFNDATGHIIAERLPGRLPAGGQRAVMNMLAVAVALVSLGAVAGTAREHGRHKLLARNFYGTLGVTDAPSIHGDERRLVHGIILHGTQLLNPAYRRMPTTYYGENSGAAMALMATRNGGSDEGADRGVGQGENESGGRGQRVGVIGLGTGTMAAYGRAGDNYRFYEINPMVVSLARTQFTFLQDSPASVDMALGDARLVLEHEPAQQFDVLVVDAFSGDAIPVHLLTREAFAVYFRHIRPGGMLAVHISNRHLDLEPVVKHAADHFNKEARVVEAREDRTKGWNSSTWAILADSKQDFAGSPIQAKGRAITARASIPPWSDNYSSILAIMK
jgi:SAM-dependent methyltransferase